MTFSTQIMLEPLRYLLKDVLLLSKIQDSVFPSLTRLYGIFAYPNGLLDNNSNKQQMLMELEPCNTLKLFSDFSDS